MKTCRNCGHRAGKICNYSGFYCKVERRYSNACGQDFTGWIPRPGLFARIKQYFMGVK